MPDNSTSPWKPVEEFPWKPVAELKQPEGQELPGGPSRLAPIFPPGQKFDMSTLLNKLRPLVAGGVGALGATAAAPTAPFTAGLGPVAGGVAAYTAADQMMRHAITSAGGQEAPSPIFSATGVKGSLEEGVTNELGGRLVGRALGALKAAGTELYNPGKVVGDIHKLKPTFSMYYQNTFDKKSVSKWIEDIFASGAKAKAIENSATLGIKAAGADVFNPQAAASSIQQGIQKGLSSSFRESNSQAELAKSIAKTNGVIIPTTVNGIITGVQHVEGPINLPNSLTTAYQYIQERKQDILNGVIPSDKQRELMNIANKIIGQSQAQFDPKTGTLVKHNPISFEDAWDLKKASDMFSTGPSGAALVTPDSTSKTFQSLSRALNEDMDASIPQWQNDPTGLATKAWKNAKATVQQRLTIFNTPGDKALSDIIDSAQSTLPAIDNILKDPKQLQRALNSGDIQFPSGKIASTNLRKDLQGYHVSKLLQDNWHPDAVAAGKGNLDMQGVINSWNDPIFADSKATLFNSSQRGNIDQFFKNLAMTQSKQMSSIVGNPKLWAIHGAVNLGSSLITGSIFKGMPGYLTALTGVRLSAGALGYLLTKPTTARLMVAMANGEALGMSEQAASRLITGAIQGRAITLVDSKGKEATGTIDKNGTFSSQ